MSRRWYGGVPFLLLVTLLTQITVEIIQASLPSSSASGAESVSAIRHHRSSSGLNSSSRLLSPTELLSRSFNHRSSRDIDLDICKALRQSKLFGEWVMGLPCFFLPCFSQLGMTLMVYGRFGFGKICFYYVVCGPVGSTELKMQLVLVRLVCKIFIVPKMHRNFYLFWRLVTNFHLWMLQRNTF